MVDLVSLLSKLQMEVKLISSVHPASIRISYTTRAPYGPHIESSHHTHAPGSLRIPFEALSAPQARREVGREQAILEDVGRSTPSSISKVSLLPLLFWR